MLPSDAIPYQDEWRRRLMEPPERLTADELVVLEVISELPELISGAYSRPGLLSRGLASWGARKRRSVPPTADEGPHPNLALSASAMSALVEGKEEAFEPRTFSPETPLSFPSSGAEDNDGPSATPPPTADSGGASAKNCKKGIAMMKTETAALKEMESVNVGQRVDGPGQGPHPLMGLPNYYLGGHPWRQAELSSAPLPQLKFLFDLNVAPPGAAEFWAGEAEQMEDNLVISAQAGKRRLEIQERDERKKVRL